MSESNISVLQKCADAFPMNKETRLITIDDLKKSSPQQIEMQQQLGAELGLPDMNIVDQSKIGLKCSGLLKADDREQEKEKFVQNEIRDSSSLVAKSVLQGYKGAAFYWVGEGHWYSNEVPKLDNIQNMLLQGLKKNPDISAEVRYLDRYDPRQRNEEYGPVGNTVIDPGYYVVARPRDAQ